MSDLRFFLPNLKITFSSFNATDKWQLAIAGGREPSSEWLKQIAGDMKVFCADKGIEAALKAGIIPKLLLGDGDSASKESYEKASILGTEIKAFPREKDDTDLQLLLNNLGQENLCITGIWGGRFDHLYSNVFSLLSWFKTTSHRILMADEKEIMIFMGSGDRVELELEKEFKPKAMSLIPLSEKTRVDFKGVHWPLKEEELYYLRPYAISNEAEEDNISCYCRSGELGLYICLEE